MQRPLYLLVLGLCACGSSSSSNGSALSSNGGPGSTARDASASESGTGSVAPPGTDGGGPNGNPGADASADAEGDALPPPIIGPTTVYDDGVLSAPWFDASWTAHVLDSTAVLQNGKHTMSVSFGAWTALCFDNESGIAPRTFPEALSFEIYGGDNTAPSIGALLYFDNTDWGPVIPIASYCDGGAIATGAWTHCAIPLAVLGSTTRTITEIALEDNSGDNLTPIALSDLQIVKLVEIDAGPDAADGDAGPDAAEAGVVDAGTDAGTLPPTN